MCVTSNVLSVISERIVSVWSGWRYFSFWPFMLSERGECLAPDSVLRATHTCHSFHFVAISKNRCKEQSTNSARFLVGDSRLPASQENEENEPPKKQKQQKKTWKLVCPFDPDRNARAGVKGKVQHLRAKLLGFIHPLLPIFC